MDMMASLAVAACLMALGFPAGALASVNLAPPGNSGVDQYFETIPGTGGNQPAVGPGSGDSGSLSAAASRQLSAQGWVGQAIARLVSPPAGPGGAPAAARARHTSRPAASDNASVNGSAAVSGSGDDAVSGVLHPILTGSSSGGVGILLPLFLAATLAVVVASAVRRRRQDSHGSRLR
jgi:hypothetical protein